MEINHLNPKPEKHLINILRTTQDHHPNFALFLGAGASITSGIKSAKEMINDWRAQHFELYGDKSKPQADHFSQFHWYDTSDEYSYLFELLYDQPSQRREYVESCIDSAFPSWGYIYLVNLIRNRVFSVVLTTNFDDLLNEACYQFSTDIRPMICAHDSSIRSLRITSKRPKVIKLHGDFLFDNIKNTLSELETLETNVREKLKQISYEFGLIVVGYAGNDRSVMDSLNTLLKNESSFPHGIYWCIRKGDSFSRNHKLDILCRHPRVHIIEIDGFDELFANLHDALELESLPELMDPYQKLTERLNALLENARIPNTNVHPVIRRDISMLGAKLSEMSKLPATEAKEGIDGDHNSLKKISIPDANSVLELPLPYTLLSQISDRVGDKYSALAYMDRQIKQNARAQDFLHAFKLIRKYEDSDRISSTFELLKEKQGVFKDNPGICNDIALELIKMKRFDEAQTVLNIALDACITSKTDDIYIRMNIIQIKKHKGESLSPKDQKYLETLKQTGSQIVIMGSQILLDEKEEAIRLIKELLEDGQITSEDVREWPIFRLLPIEITEDGTLSEI